MEHPCVESHFDIDTDGSDGGRIDLVTAFDDHGVELMMILLVSTEHLDGLRELMFRADLLASKHQTRERTNSNRHRPLVDTCRDVVCQGSS